MQAVHNYAEQYFVGEVRNNIAGILQDQKDRQQKTQAFFEALKGVSSAKFTLAEMQDELEGDVPVADSKRLLRQLFEVGAIGIKTKVNGVERTDFVYRKASPVAFNSRRNFLLHNSLVAAWNKART